MLLEIHNPKSIDVSTNIPVTGLASHDFSQTLCKLDHLIKIGWGLDKNNRIKQYRQSIDLSIPHVTPHAWLRYYLNIEADKLDPKRHRYLDPNLINVTPPENENSFIGVMPLASSAYFLMLEEADLVPNIQTCASPDESYNAIGDSMRKLFTGKKVFFLPGRTGYEAKMASSLGSKVGIVTNNRYINGATSLLKDENLALILECNLDEALLALSHFRSDIQKLYGTIRFDMANKIAVVNDPVSDISISTNMFNVGRFDKNNGPHYVLPDWRILMARILATGKVNSTVFYVTPAIDYQPAFTKEELVKSFGHIAKFNFYNPDRSGGASVERSVGDFAFSARLNCTVPSEMLKLN